MLAKLLKKDWFIPKLGHLIMLHQKFGEMSHMMQKVTFGA